MATDKNTFYYVPDRNFSLSDNNITIKEKLIEQRDYNFDLQVEIKSSLVYGTKKHARWKALKKLFELQNKNKRLDTLINTF